MYRNCFERRKKTVKVFKGSGNSFKHCNAFLEFCINRRILAKAIKEVNLKASLNDKLRLANTNWRISVVANGEGFICVLRLLVIILSFYAIKGVSFKKDCSKGFFMYRDCLKRRKNLSKFLRARGIALNIATFFFRILY